MLEHQSASMPIGKPLCFPWDIEKAGSPSGPSGPSNLPAPSTSPSTIDPKPTPSGGNSCTVKTTGKTGTCTTTAQCKSSGGNSTPGYCPDDPSDVQVSFFAYCDFASGRTDWFLVVLYLYSTGSTQARTVKFKQHVYSRSHGPHWRVHLHELLLVAWRQVHSGSLPGSGEYPGMC